MSEGDLKVLRDKLIDEHLEKLMRFANPKLHRFVAQAITLCEPTSVFVATDARADSDYIRRKAVETGEETPLATEGHTVHFDGCHDQARDRANTRYLVPPGDPLEASLNTVAKEEGLAEVTGYLRGSMRGREMLVCFFALGPTNSPFTIPAVQVTDSYYVAHSNRLLYRPGYEQFHRLGGGEEFFRVLHSVGVLRDGVSVEVEHRRIYIDLEEDIVYSVNTQYAGNTVGFKKLSLRLAIRKADREGWLAEHMFVMGVRGPGGRTTYLTGAFPSFCGKTSTAMIPGETIVGDDLAYLKKRAGAVRAANVERGIFGIIRNVNPQDDPIIYEAITSPGEVIFSNVLVADGVPYWLGAGRPLPARGINYSGEWYPGKTDPEGNEITPAHKNARYTIRLSALSNLDPRAEDPEGVPVGGIIFGGRDSDTWVPIQQSFDWAHGVVTMGASLESESTAATLGQEGVRNFQPMSNLDFVSIPLGRYIENHLNFAGDLSRAPLIFAGNYFLRDPDGDYLTGMNDKRVWIKWMELRVHGDLDALTTPTGYIPRYEDLKRLFKEVLNLDYSPAQYTQQFTLRIPEHLRKLERIEHIYRSQVPDTPPTLFRLLEEQRGRLLEAQKEHGPYVPPTKF